MSAPRTRQRPTGSNNTGPALVPSLASVSTADICRAELDAMATLNLTFMDEARHSCDTRRKGLDQSRSTGALGKARQSGWHKNVEREKRATRTACGRARPSSAKNSRKIPSPFDYVGQQEPTTTSTRQRGRSRPRSALASTRWRSGESANPGDSYQISMEHCLGPANRRQMSADLDGYRMFLAEHTAARKRETERASSDVSIRYVPAR